MFLFENYNRFHIFLKLHDDTLLLLLLLVYVILSLGFHLCILLGYISDNVFYNL